MNNHLKSILKVCGIVGLICLVTVLSCLPFVNFDNNKAVLNADLNPSGVVIGTDESYPYDHYFELSYLDFYLSNLSSVNDWAPTNASVYPIKFKLSMNQLFFLFGNYNDGRFEHYQIITPSVYGQWVYDYLDPFSIGVYIRMQYYIDNNFDFSSISLCYLERSNEWGTNQWLNYHIEMIDTNNYRYRIKLFYHPSDPSNFNWLDYQFTPIYFVIGGEVLDNNSYYQQGYQDGKQDGLNDNQEGIYNTGFRNGKDYGYQLGLNEQDVYTFGNLLTAVIDAPVGVFISMLDFTIMGFNLLNLVVGLLTLAVICLVIKLMLGGK